MTHPSLDQLTKVRHLIKIIMKANSQENSFIKYNNRISLRNNRKCNNHKMFIEFKIINM